MYSGDVKPQAAFDALVSDRKTLLIDVRTPAEWTYVGMPQMAGMIQASWPPDPQSPGFAKTIENMGVPKDFEIYLICRSGVRSAHAASELITAGYTTCFNVAEGFEGDRDNQGHRGTIGGWKVAGLPWQQG